MDSIVILKKYANRRLYNTASSKYVTLSELGDMVREGQQVKVIEADSKDDVTAFILTQIVLEQAKSKNTLLPVPLLHLIICYGDNILLDFFNNYLNQIIHNYLNYKKSFDDQFQHWLDLGMDMTKGSGTQMPNYNPFKAFFDGFESQEEKKSED